MRVRILQGKQTGLLIDVDQSEGENLLTTGFAELAAALDAAVHESTAAPVAPEPVAEPAGPEPEVVTVTRRPRTPKPPTRTTRVPAQRKKRR